MGTLPLRLALVEVATYADILHDDSYFASGHRLFSSGIETKKLVHRTFRKNNYGYSKPSTAQENFGRS